MALLVDDQLALLANLGVLELAPEIEMPLLTVYAFQLRLASAIAVDRSSEGVLQRLLREYLPDGLDVAMLASHDSDRVRVIDPTRLAVAISRARLELHCNTLAAEVVAVARREDAQVRLTPGNAHGQLWETLTAAGIPRAVWTLSPTATGMTVVEG